MACPVVHWEICGQDARKLQDFYSALFGWKIDTSNPMGYGLVETGGEGGINGGISGMGGGVTSYVTFYVLVDDLQAYLDRAESLGGKTIIPPTVIQEAIGSFAMFTDPEGHCIGLFKQ